MRNQLARFFAIDPRALAAFRIGLGVLLLVDLAIRATDLVAHYTGAGMLPRSLLADYYDDDWRWSVYFLFESPEAVAGLFVLAAIAAAALLVGYRTRLATIVSWVLLVSLQTRNPLVINAGDTLLRLLLMWSIFLPLARCWSMDAWRRNKAPPANAPVYSVASGAIILQICLVYWMSGYFKFSEVWRSGEALEWALSYDAYAKPLANWALEYPQVVRWLGAATLWTELLGPVLVFSPVWTRQIRIAVVAGFLILHLGVELTIHVGLFSCVSMVGWIVLLPDTFWDALTRRKEPAHEQVVAATQGKSPWSMLGQAVAGLLLALVIVWNLWSMGISATRWLMPTPLRKIGQATAVMQKWSMFGRPPRVGGWMLTSARLADGRMVDVLRRGQPTSWEAPEHVAGLAPNHRWRKLYRNLTFKRNARFHADFCRYLARQWNATHPPEEQIETLQLFYMKRRTAPGSEWEEPQLIQYYLLDVASEVSQSPTRN